MRRARGFTLIEMLAVLVILVTLAAIVVPRFINAGTRSREAALKQTLAEVRQAITIFRNDTGYYPNSLNDLVATRAPAHGRDKYGQLRPIDPSNWHGPYLDKLPVCPISKQPFQYFRDPTTGAYNVRSPAPGRAEDGTYYRDW